MHHRSGAESRRPPLSKGAEPPAGAGAGAGAGSGSVSTSHRASSVASREDSIAEDLERVLATVRAGTPSSIRRTITTTTTVRTRIRPSGPRPSADGLDPSILCMGSHVMLKTGSSATSGFLSSNGPGVADLSGLGLGLSGELLTVVSPNVTSLKRDAEDTGPVVLGEEVALRCGALNRYLCVDPGSGNLTFTKLRQRWEVMSADSATAGRGAGAGASGDSFVHINERVCLRSKSGLCLQTLVDAHGMARVCIGAPSSLGPAQAGSLDWFFVQAHSPFEPEWNRTRPFLTGAELATTGGDTHPPTSALEDIPMSLQERLLVEDLLYALLGIEGEYIKVKRPEIEEDLPGYGPKVYDVGMDPAPTARGSFEGLDATMQGMEFLLQRRDTLDTSLAFLVERILPVCRHYVRCSWYVEIRSRYEAGLVANAFASACRLLLREYTLLVAQLEHLARQGRLSLQKMWFFLQPSLRTLATLDSIIFAAPFAMGGALLNSVHKAAARSGDTQGRSVAQFLLERAAVPYMRVLEQWIFDGVLKDPHGEFMVVQDETLSKDTMLTEPDARYWEERFTIRKEQVPTFLESLEDGILTTGKYLNVLRECGSPIGSPVAMTIPFAEDARDYSGIVHKAFNYASTTLLKHILDKTQFLSRLGSLKRFFLLHAGDFLVHFLDLADRELSKPVAEITLPRLQALLDLSLRTSIAGRDPFKDHLVCVLQPLTLLRRLETMNLMSAGAAAAAPTTKPLVGWDVFCLDYKVKWPLSIVLSRAALSRYQMLFQQLFFCKFVERRLCNTWLSQQETKELRLGDSFAQWNLLRHRMLHFMQNFTFYMMTEVLEPRWQELEAAMSRAADLDELKSAHDDFLFKCLDQCLLTPAHLELLKILTKLTTLCLLFADQVQRLMSSLSKARSDAAATVSSRRAKDVTFRHSAIKENSEQFARTISQHANVRSVSRDREIFDQHLRQFMSKLRDRASAQFNSHLANLCTRLDYNSFYSGHLSL